MNHLKTTIWLTIRKSLLITLCYLIAAQPLIATLMPAAAQAAEVEEITTQYSDDAACAYVAAQAYDPDVPDSTYTELPTSGEETSDVVDAFSIEQVFSLTELKTIPSIQDRIDQITSRKYVDAVLNVFGPVGMTYYKSPAVTKNGTVGNEELVIVCDNASRLIDPQVFNPYAPMQPEVFMFMNTLEFPDAKIAFANQIDRYALLGERCAGGFIDKPSADWTASDEPCLDFKLEDDVFQNKKWDAPKTDPRVLQTLLYLVAPLEEGGAGREFIRVKKLIQNTKDNPLNIVLPVQEVSNEEEDLNTSLDENIYGANTNEVIIDTEEGEDGDTLVSDNYLNPEDPPHKPSRPVHSVFIDQIDKFRVATRVVEKRLLGNNSTSYSVQSPQPVEVSWQTDDGLQRNPPPDYSSLSMVESARMNMNATVVEMLNQLGLGDLEIDVSDMGVNSYADIATVIGQSLLEQLLGSPRGGMKGWNLASNLQSIGLSFLEQDLGLVPGSLADTNPLDTTDTSVDFSNMTEDIGRATIEYVLEFPSGSLRTQTGSSAEVLESVGRRYLETNIFQVSEGTLTPSEGYPLKTVGDLLERLGEGRIEFVFKLPKQSLRKPTYENQDSQKSFRESSFKASLLFTKLSNSRTDEDYDMADYLEGQLSLSFTPFRQFDKNGNPVGAGTTNMYGFTADDFKFPTLTIDPTNPGSLSKFKRLVGSRTVETSLGIFKQQGGDDVYVTSDARIPESRDINVGGNMVINPQLQPLVSEAGSVCYGGDSTRLSILTRAYEEGVAQFREFIANNPGLNPDSSLYKSKKVGINPDIVDYDGFISMLNRYQQDNDYNHIDIPCVKPTGDASSNGQVSILTDSRLPNRMRDVLFNTTPLDRWEFRNQEQQPRYEDIARGSDAGARYRTALSIFYSNPDNRSKVALNYFADKETLEKTNQQSDPSTSTDPQAKKVVAEVLAKIGTGGQMGSQYTLPADADFQARLTMVQNRLNDDITNDTFNITKLINSGVTAEMLDAELTKRINNLMQVPDSNSLDPATNAFPGQYKDAQYNGWIFMLSDLSGRIQCKINGGTWGLNSDQTLYSCQGAGADQRPAADTIMQLQGAKTFVDRLSQDMGDTLDALIAAVKTKSYTQPDFNKQPKTGYDIATGLLSLTGRTFDENRRLSSAVPDASTDIVKNLVAPGIEGVVPLNTPIEGFFKRGADQRSLLGEAGRAYAARKFGTNELASTTFSAQLKTDFAAAINTTNNVTDLFDQAEKASQNYGLDHSSLLEKGLADGDFQRIFMLDEANEVFDRVGKEQLLRTVWRKSGASSQIKTSAQYQQILVQFRQIQQDILFYTERIKKIQTLSSQLDGDLEALGGKFTKINTLLKQVNSKSVGDTIDQPKKAQEVARRYEPLASVLKKEGKAAGQAGLQVTRKAYEIVHLGQEIITGRALPRDENFDDAYADANQVIIAGSEQKSQTDCFSKGQIISTLIGKGDLTAKVQEVALRGGTCSLEKVFGAPTDLFYAWYKLGEQQFPQSSKAFTETIDENGMPVLVEAGTPADFGADDPNTTKYYETLPDGKVQALVPTWNKGRWTIENLQLAAGITDKMQRDPNFKLDLNLLHEWLSEQSNATINDLATRGEKVLQLTVIARLLSLIPGFGTLAKQYALTSNDLVAVLQGNLKPVISKVGGTVLDKALNIPLGTSAELLYPTCRSNTGAKVACTKDPNQPGTDPDNIRTQTMAKMGLEKLGLVIPNFPAYFDITAGGDLATNWGNAVISKDLNLAPNSFRGKITDSTYLGTPLQSDCEKAGLRGQNTTETLMRAFGLSQSPTMRNLKAITSAMQAALTQTKDKNFSAGEEFARSTLRSDTNLLIEKHLEKMTLARLRENPIDSNLGYWTNITDPASVSANATTLATMDQVQYGEAVQELWNATKSDYYSDGARQDIRRALLRSLQQIKLRDGTAELVTNLLNSDLTGASMDFPRVLQINLAVEVVEGTNTLYETYIRYFSKRVTALNTQYGVDATTFQRLLHGDIAAEDIAGKVGLARTAGDILGNEIDEWIAKDGPTWLKQLNQAFKYITEEQCSVSGFGGNEKQGIGRFLTRTVAGTNGCFENIGRISSNDILYGTSSSMKGLRNFLFDNFLAQTFSRELEEQIGLRGGTFKRIVDDPSNGRQILMTEGISLVTNKLFGDVKQNDSCLASTRVGDDECTRRVVNNAVREAFVAGFCNDFAKNDCSFRFDTGRSVKQFNKMADQALDKSLNRIGQEYLGMSINRADVRVSQGDLRGIALLSIQYTANQLNKSLFNGNKNSPLARFYKTYYQDIRVAAGMSPLSAYDQQAKVSEGEYGFLYDQVCQLTLASLPPSCSSLSRVALQEEYARQLFAQGGFDSLDTARAQATSEMTQAGKSNLGDFERDRRNNAYRTVQYAMLDILAFSKDQNIPPNFSKRLLGKSGSDRAMALVEYGMNAVIKENSPLGRVLRTACAGSGSIGNCATLFREFADVLGRPDAMTAFFKTNGAFLEVLDRGMSGWFESELGIELPDNTLKGLYVWGMQGFKGTDFNREGFCLGTTKADGSCDGTIAVPIGRILQDFGEKALTDWADKNFGLKKGTAASIVKIYDLIQDQSKLGNMKLIEANRIAISQLASKILTDAFSEDLKEADKILGLPPGTTSIVVGAGITYGISIVSSVSASAASAAAFGPAFFLALGFQVVFGVSGVEVTNSATADGYYPFYSSFNAIGSGPASACTGNGSNPLGGCKAERPYTQINSRNESSGTFNPTVSQSYREGLKAAARSKVRSLIIDLMLFPTSRWAQNQGLAPKSIWIGQIQTYGGAGSEYDPTLDSVITEMSRQNTPFHIEDPTYGFGHPLDRCETVTYDPVTDQTMCKRFDYIRTGIFGTTQLPDSVYFLWNQPLQET